MNGTSRAQTPHRDLGAKPAADRACRRGSERKNSASGPRNTKGGFPACANRKAHHEDF
jgi:hypothetical protein